MIFRSRGSIRSPLTPKGQGGRALAPRHETADVGLAVIPEHMLCSYDKRALTSHREAWVWVSLRFYSDWIISLPFRSISGPRILGRESGSVRWRSRRGSWPSRNSVGNRVDPSALGRSLTNPTKSRPWPGISGFGFKRLQDFSAEGLGDIQLGAKYQYLHTRDSRLAATAGVRFPTGRQHDPDDLADVAWRTVRRSEWETPSL